MLDAIEELRRIPEKEIQGIDTYYTMNIFGAWDVGIWFNAENAKTALDFVHSTLRKVTGVVDSYVIPMFPQYETVTATPTKPEKAQKNQEKIAIELTH